MSGHCQKCRRRRPQVYVKVGKVKLHVCPNCAKILEAPKPVAESE